SAMGASPQYAVDGATSACSTYYNRAQISLIVPTRTKLKCSRLTARSRSSPRSKQWAERGRPPVTARCPTGTLCWVKKWAFAVCQESYPQLVVLRRGLPSDIAPLLVPPETDLPPAGPGADPRGRGVGRRASGAVPQPMLCVRTTPEYGSVPC